MVLTVLLTGRECPWHCLMCDLWRHTVAETTPAGAIPAQIDYALAGLGEAPGVGSVIRQIKLYNSGSFFDTRAIPPGDHAAIAQRVCGFERVIVESHPALVGEAVARWRDLLAQTAARKFGPGRQPPALEVAMGLETAHPRVLPRLNKRMTLGRFQRAAAFLRAQDVALRAFVLVKPPFLGERAALAWAGRSVDFALDCGASVVVLIPTRAGNGALEALAARGQFAPPRLELLEAALEQGLRQSRGRGRVFADLWGLERIAGCASCFPARASRLRKMNLEQAIAPPTVCADCGAPAARDQRGRQ